CARGEGLRRDYFDYW
nr:immunoglobulin heavy chain junction region [Mus musculus]MBK4187377.1 immunoglobulin heavy chain junction region [Mus musculus]MBK4187378.1 immunoglobulin heavy chain junction region [Mus musculus]MBK4187379.1 immunoglobulin heavy chain junction region [Mus musculus]MBK4187380.1 immunoglobulin heavy chain junction region [Mus musculus]